MRSSLLHVLSLLLAINAFAQQSYSLYSPDSSIRLEIKTKEKLSWHLYSGKEFLTQSTDVDLQLKDQKKLSDKLVVSSHWYTKTNETITVPVPYRRKTIADKYNQLELIFKELFSIQFRLYNDGNEERELAGLSR